MFASYIVYSFYKAWLKSERHNPILKSFSTYLQNVLSEMSVSNMIIGTLNVSALITLSLPELEIIAKTSPNGKKSI